MDNLLISKNDYDGEADEETGSSRCIEQDYERKRRASEHLAIRQSHQGLHSLFTIFYQLLILKTD